MVEEKRGRSWQIDKTLNLGHLISMSALASALFVWAVKMDSRVTVLEAQVTMQGNICKIDHSRIEMQARDSINTVNESLLRIEDKLDRKQDKR